MLADLGFDTTGMSRAQMASKLNRELVKLDATPQPDAQPSAAEESLAVFCHGSVNGAPCGRDLLATKDWNVVFFKPEFDTKGLTRQYMIENAYCSGCAVAMLTAGEVAEVRRVEVDGA